MNLDTLISIAYIACRIISGRRITALYDIDRAEDIDIKKILDAEFIREFDKKHRECHARGCMYEYKPSTGHPIEIFIDRRNFIIHIKGSSAYFIGNVHKNSICFYNHKDEAHFKYEIKGWSKENEKVTVPRHAHALRTNAGLF